MRLFLSAFLERWGEGLRGSLATVKELSDLALRIAVALASERNLSKRQIQRLMSPLINRSALPPAGRNDLRP